LSYADEETFAYTHRPSLLDEMIRGAINGIQSLKGKRIATGLGWELTVQWVLATKIILNDATEILNLVRSCAGYDDVVDRNLPEMIAKIESI